MTNTRIGSRQTYTDIDGESNNLDFISYHNVKKFKTVAYSSQGSHTSQLDFCNWLTDGSMTG